MTSIREVLMNGGLALTPSEEKIVQVLLTDYPTSGLGTATGLARRAGVSDPTVVRLVMKLGFAGFPDFQSKLLAEVESRLHSPLLMMAAKRPPSETESAAVAYLGSVSTAVERTLTAAPVQTYERAARLIVDAKGEVLLLGGRFSRHVAGMMAGYLTQFRPGVHDLGALAAHHYDTLLDLDRRDVLIAFDYRRYQLDVVSYARQAAARGVRILLFTDPWLSPIAENAEVTLVAPTEVASPYDTLAPVAAQMEAVVAQILAAGGDDMRTRIERLEEVRRANGVTIDGGSDGFDPTPHKAKPNEMVDMEDRP